MAEYLAPAAPLESSRGRAEERPVPDGAGREVLLLCPQCDEAFAPRFYRWCPQCGQDAGTGIDTRVSGNDEPLSEHALLILGVLISLVTAIVLYFRWLFS